MRICLMTREYPPDTGWGGIGTFTYNLANSLAARGHDVQVVALTGNSLSTGRALPTLLRPHPDDAGRPVIHRVPARRFNPAVELFNFLFPVTRPMIEETVALWSAALKLHQEKPFDVIECPEHFAEGLFPGVARLAPLVVRLHTPHSKLVKEKFHNFQPTFDHRVLSSLERVAMVSADALACPSEDLARYVAADLNLPVERITIVRNAVDTQTFTPDGARALGPDDNLRILFVGRLEPRKGVEYLFQAIPAVVKECPSARFVIMGSDTPTADGHSSMLARLKATLVEHDCEQFVEFIQHVPVDQIGKYYRSADICVLPSLYDNAPMTVIEAMACGKPIVASSAGGAKEYAPTGRCGTIVPPSDANALAEALVTLLQSPALREQYGKSARQRAVEHFSTDKLCEDTLALYERARDNYARRQQAALYTNEPEVLLDDLDAVVASLERRLYEMMFSYSWRFRLRHWHRRAKEVLHGRSSSSTKV